MTRGLLTVVLLSLSGSATAAETTYESDVRPILKAHCFQCHGEEGIEGGLDLRLRRFIAAGGESGPAIVPGNADGSLLIMRVANGEMPPDEDKHLGEAEVAILSRWIADGAPTAREEPESLEDGPYFTEEERNWWAFQPVRKPRPPATDIAIETPIDAFLLAKRAELAESDPDPEDASAFAPEADRSTLIRRVSLNLLGIPPSPEEVREFAEDAGPDAWARLIDRVLSSPHYGEHWGRHWLDVAGYADSEGYTDEDRVREHAWRYRDYVIGAFNQDKPYSEFVTEQLAGDELAGWPDTGLRPEIIEKLAATGFLRMAPDGTASGGIDQDLARNQVIADTMQIVGSALLGLTVHCAQCHDHRYDPIPTRDYYQMRAVFEPALNWKNWRAPPNRLVSLYSEDERQLREEIETEAKEIDARRQERVDFYIDKTLEHELLMVADDLREPLRSAFGTKAAERTENQTKLLKEAPNIARITAGSLYLYDRRREARAKDLDARREERLAGFVQQVKDEALAELDEATRNELLAALEVVAEERTAQQAALVSEHPAVAVTAETLAEFDPAAAAELERYTVAAAEIREYRIREELQKLADEAKAVRDTIPKEHFLRILSEVSDQPPPETFVFHRGDHQQPSEQVAPAGLSILDAPTIAPPGDRSTSGRRLAFARYLTNGEHPLLARVIVNRIWAHHFGRGIVSTTGDFGVLGDRPTHPALLDWLAAELVESGWSLKHIHRLILTSRVYQQSATGSEALVTADPDNRLLGRWPLRRIESEGLRDVILQTVGKLNPGMSGEPIPVMEDEVGQIILGRENLDGERKPTDLVPLLGDEFRRSVYVQVRRTRPLGVLEVFDLPELAPNCTERASSNVATQSLMLMNSDFIIAMSEAMADRLITERPKEPNEQLRWGWEVTFGRVPGESQMERARKFLQVQTEALTATAPDEMDPHRAALATYCQALLGSNQFLYIE